MSFASSGMAGLQTYFELRLLDVLVSAASLEFSAGDVPQESFSLRPARVEYAFRQQLANGSFGPWAFLCVDYAAGTSSDGQCS